MSESRWASRAPRSPRKRRRWYWPTTTSPRLPPGKRRAHGLQQHRKGHLFMLPTNVAQALVIMVAIFIGFTAPITAPQILWVNMVTSVALGLVISFEPHELDVMHRQPRAVDRPIVDA